jgi:hypothetical protein
VNGYQKSRDLNATLKLFGKIQRTELIETKDQDGVRRRRYRVRCERGQLLAMMLIDDKNKIGYLNGDFTWANPNERGIA